jgi:HSP20 family molecular chaperone IbpA
MNNWLTLFISSVLTLIALPLSAQTYGSPGPTERQESELPMPSPFSYQPPSYSSIPPSLGLPPPYPSLTPSFGPASSYATGPNMHIETESQDDSYFIIVHLMGYPPEDIGISVDPGNNLVLYSTRSEEHQDQAEGFYRRMTSVQRFSRRLSLPWDADTSRMTRVNKEGTIELTIPRSLESPSR